MYKLTVEPHFAVGGKLVTWTLGIYRITREGVEGENLLAPRIPNWHGLQAFDFNALDLARPPDKGFGRVRIFHLSSFTLVAVVEAFDLIPTRDAFAELTLYIEAK